MGTSFDRNRISDTHDSMASFAIPCSMQEMQQTGTACGADTRLKHFCESCMHTAICDNNGAQAGQCSVFACVCASTAPAMIPWQCIRGTHLLIQSYPPSPPGTALPELHSALRPSSALERKCAGTAVQANVIGLLCSITRCYMAWNHKVLPGMEWIAHECLCAAHPV